ncbi:MAG: FkbM family methyltransferase [Arenicellales bacterium]
MAFKALKQFLRKKKLARFGIALDVVVPFESYGERSGCWTVAPQFLSSQSIVYSVGVGNNIAWDIEMIRRHQVELHAFDPTPRSVAWIARQPLPPRFIFHAIGLSDRDGAMVFSAPKREGKFNYRPAAFAARADTISCEVKTLHTLRETLGHARIDVLKMDIEGAEMAVLKDVGGLEPLPGQLLIEFHYHYPGMSFESFVDVISGLRAVGYRIFHISARGYEFSMIHERLLKR